MMRAQGIVWVAVAASLVACGDGSDTRVSLDLGPLWQQAGQSSQVDWINVRVYDDAGVLEVTDVLSTTDDAVDLVVTIGAARRFEVEAVYDDAGVETPTFWGERIIDIEPMTNIELVVPIFPILPVQGGG